MQGLQISNAVDDPSNSVSVSRGFCFGLSGNENFELNSSLTKTLSSNWEAGSGVGGLDGGVVQDRTYHVHIIRPSAGGSAEILLSASPDSPSLPAGFSSFRRIGSIIRKNGAILPFTQRGNYFLLQQPVQDVNETDPGNKAITVSLTVPSGVSVLADVSYSYADTSEGNNFAFGRVFSTSQIDEPVKATCFTALAASAGGRMGLSGCDQVLTDTACQIRFRANYSSPSTTVRINTIGWVDERETQKVFRLLSVGASNNGGHSGGAASPNGWEVLAPKIRVLNNSNDSSSRSIGQRFKAPEMEVAPFDRNSGPNESACVWAMQTLLNDGSDRIEGQVLNVTQSGGVSQWEKSNSDLYDHIVGNWAASGGLPFTHFIWLQGGTDAASETYGTSAWDTMKDAYVASVVGIVEDLKADGVLATDCKIAIVGHSAPDGNANVTEYDQFNIQAYPAIATALDNAVFVPGDDLPTQSPSNVHYTPESHKALGERIGQMFGTI